MKHMTHYSNVKDDALPDSVASKELIERGRKQANEADRLRQQGVGGNETYGVGLRPWQHHEQIRRHRYCTWSPSELAIHFTIQPRCRPIIAIDVTMKFLT